MLKIVERLLEYGFVTGSRVFGTAREDSDIDIVYPIYYSQHIARIIEGHDITRSDYFSGYYISDEGKIINLIPVHPHEFLPWYLATKAIEATLILSNIKDPIKKYAVFQGIVCLYKGTVEEKLNIKEYELIARSIINNQNKDIEFNAVEIELGF